MALRSFNDNRFVFEETEKIADGLGPMYNAQSCRECHQNVVTGGASQVAELRTGYLKNGVFFESLGGSLIQSRSTHPDLVERVIPNDAVRTLRISTNTLGNGFVEAIANGTLLAIRDAQPAEMRGTAVSVPVLEAGNVGRIGRFGWKSQHASLESFSADAYLNEMGITSPLLKEENTSSGQFVGFGSGYDPVDEPEDDGTDVKAFADFMRSTKAPSRGPINGERRGRRSDVQPDRLCNLSRAVDHHRAGGHEDQRRNAHCSPGAREQGHPPLQRLPAARHRHRRRDPDPAHRRVRVDREQDAHRSPVGAPHAKPAHARRAVVHAGGRDSEGTRGRRPR